MYSSNFSVTNHIIRQKSQRMKCITVGVLGFAILAILLAYVAFGDKDVIKNPAIKVAYVIFRHGDRNPTESYPTDPYNDLKYWPGGWGSLTNKGKLQMYKLGEFLRSRYRDLLGDVYSPDRLLVRSSDHDRCLMSAGALLAALQPPSTSEMWLTGLHWQPIPVHATPRSLDNLIVVKKPCPRYDKELQSAYQSNRILQVDREYYGLYQNLTKYTGQNVSNVLQVEFLFNTLEIEDGKGLHLPEWTKFVYPEPMKKVALISLEVFTQTPLLKQILGGPLLNDVKEKMLANSRNTFSPKPQVFLISAHDVTVINVMRALGFDNSPKPDIGAAILLEMHAGPAGFSGSDDFVKIFYMNSSSTTEPYQLSLPGCREPCSLTDFISLTSHVSVTSAEWEKICLS